MCAVLCNLLAVLSPSTCLTESVQSRDDLRFTSPLKSTQTCIHSPGVRTQTLTV
ncbi:hypothetical protein EXN66_Car022435 [Channa argus]|uniref:Uncharacterized protein n=1 Tax=Channa argus TaxID=215402 RepID=A0A6G1QWQ9_CHAAH|nr:hypothetical protein EXN66_Car022435 [Channa argus]